uniref:Helicase ATP-binding domain-containing protein n=1 Tax=Parastrongyloides trichosuri TaxID=131310 RepID=A0A0N4ZNG7_PARTI
MSFYLKNNNTPRGSSNDPVVISSDDSDEEELHNFPALRRTQRTIKDYFAPIKKTVRSDNDIVILSVNNSNVFSNLKRRHVGGNGEVFAENKRKKIENSNKSSQISSSSGENDKKENNFNKSRLLITYHNKDKNCLFTDSEYESTDDKESSIDNNSPVSNDNKFDENVIQDLADASMNLDISDIQGILEGKMVNNGEKSKEEVEDESYQLIDLEDDSFVARGGALFEVTCNDSNTSDNDSKKEVEKEEKLPVRKYVKEDYKDIEEYYNENIKKKDQSDTVVDPTDVFEDRTKTEQLENYRTYGEIVTLSRFTIEEILSVDKSKRLLGGLMTDNRYQMVTSKLYNLMKTVLSFVENYDKKMKINTPKNFVGELKEYQMEGLAFLVAREFSYPCGGILADDMGLGKTAQMIALILYQKANKKENELLEDIRVKVAENRGLFPIKTTLIVSPSSLMNQWMNEIAKFSKKGKLRTTIFHGSKKMEDPKKLGDYDIIITSYNTLVLELDHLLEGEEEDEDDGENFKVNRKKEQKEARKRKGPDNSILTQVCFQRIILDEAHSIKNRKTKTSKACTRLSALRRWCVTGTPINNDLWDGFSLFRFLRTVPVDQEGIWKQFVNSNSKYGQCRLEILVSAMLIRRTKEEKNDEGRFLVKLPERKIEQVTLNMAPEERLIYDQMYRAAQQYVMSFLGNYSDTPIDYITIDKVSSDKNPFLNVYHTSMVGESKFKEMACILSFLLRLRQACNHLFLTRNGLDLECFDAIGGECKETSEKANSIVEKILNETDEKNDHLRVFEEDFVSSKMNALFERIDKILSNTEDKIVIISQWTSMLRLIHPHLKKRQIEFSEITGDIVQKCRDIAQENINSDDSSVRVMLLSLKAGGVGLNLVGANHIFILDLHWNPYIEDQACDRIYRIGQNKDVFIYKFVCKDTIEQKILNLHEKKKGLSNMFLGKASEKKGNQLNNEDLAFLFGMEKK